MQENRSGWWLATFAAAAAGVCFVLAAYGATGQFRPAGAGSAPVAGSAAATAGATGGGNAFAPAPKPVGAVAAGTCLALTVDSPGNIAQVGCDQAHQLEVVASVDLDPSVTVYPTAAEWRQIATTCTTVAEQYVGRPLVSDQAPRLVSDVLRIDPTNWTSGQRSTPCVVAEVDAAGKLVTRTARLRP